MVNMVSIRSENEHQADNDRLAMVIIIKDRQQHQPRINRHSHRKVHRNRWMVNYRQTQRQQRQNHQPHDPDKSKRRRNKSTMSMWQSIWWVNWRHTHKKCIEIETFPHRVWEYKRNIRAVAPNLSPVISKSFPILPIKICRNQNKRIPSQQKKTTNTLDETYSDMSIHSVCQCHSVWWHFDSNIRISQTIPNDEVADFRFFRLSFALAKISFPGENQYLPRWMI